MNDENVKFNEIDDGYMLETKVNYSSNKKLTTQKIYFNKDKDINKVEVFDEDGMLKIIMNISKIEYNKNLSHDYFNLNNNLTVSTIEENVNKTIEQVIYPMYMPENTYLSSENKVSKDNGERIIMTFSGDNSFMFIQETATISQNLNVIPTNGEPYLLADSVGSVGENSVEWVSKDMEYYLISETMTKEELLNVAKSLSVMPVGK